MKGVPIKSSTTLKERLQQGIVIGAEGYLFELDPFEHTRSEMATFALDCKKLGVNYIGTCCGAGPHHVRAIAEALGRTVPASRYSPDLSQHAMLGKNVQEHNQPDMDKWKD